MNRRNFIQAGFASSFLLGANSFLRGEPSVNPFHIGRPGSHARNVIFLVSDGMSSGSLSFTDQFIRWRDSRPSNWIRLYEEEKVRRGLMETASANSIVTDSAAASAAWGGGARVNNNAINITPDGAHRTPILQIAKEAGKATGLVTTATVSHATPAGFAANVLHRKSQPEIAEQYLDRRIDLIMGGGAPFFDPEKRDDKRDLLGDFQRAGYGIARSRAELETFRGGSRPLLALLADGYLPYEIDRLMDPALTERIPALAELTSFALERLNQRREGFVVQIEGARIDHGAHANDIAGLLYDQVAFDEAIGVAMDFAEKEGDTLVILTTDHGNANPGLSSGDARGERNFAALSQFRGTHHSILSRISAESSLHRIQEIIHEVTGQDVTRDEAHILRRRLEGIYTDPYRRLNGVDAVLGQILANHTDIGWVGNAHTSDHVEVAAFGPGSEGLRMFQKNTDLFNLMLTSLHLQV